MKLKESARHTSDEHNKVRFCPGQPTANGNYYRLALPHGGSEENGTTYMRVVSADALRYELTQAAKNVWTLLRVESSDHGDQWSGTILYVVEASSNAEPPVEGWLQYTQKVKRPPRCHRKVDPLHLAFVTVTVRSEERVTQSTRFSAAFDATAWLGAVWQDGAAVAHTSTLGLTMERLHPVPLAVSRAATGLMLAMQHRDAEVRPYPLSPLCDI